MRDADSEKREASKHRRVGEFLDALIDGRGAAGIKGGVVTRVTLRLPASSEPECLVVVKVQGEGGEFVGFVGGLDIVQAILVWRAKDAAKGLKWRVDKPWTP